MVLSAVRTPFGRIRGSLSSVRPDDLAAVVVREALNRSGAPDESLDEVILGCANQAGEDNRNVARMALLLAGLPDRTSGLTVNRLCASGLSAVASAARLIRCGEASLVVAGGVESMTRAPYSVPKNPTGFGPTGNQTMFDTSLGWRYPNPLLEARFPLEAMGVTAENIVQRSFGGEFGGPITREDQDELALESHRRAAAARGRGVLTDELVAVATPSGQMIVDDEQPRIRAQDDGYVVDTSLEDLSRLRPAFRPGGSVTAGNSSSLNDGAGALVLASRKFAQANDLQPIARILGAAAVGVDPTVMGSGPIPAVRTLLGRHHLEVDDVGLFEVNEAFAAQVIAVRRSLRLPPDRVNVNGGAIAFGHPLGASGARILTTLIHELRRRGGEDQSERLGVATLCVGVGQGEALLLEAER
ncbi:MAG: thiolase family protein [Actinomycetota bacterium]|nr:thiolase family protein [Actinomycetota bacterium]